MNGRTFVLSLTPVLALLVSWGSPPAFGQFQSAIEGTVRDQSGAVIAAANVTATDSQLGVTRTTTSSTAGYFRLESIAASTYTVRIEASGFQNWEQKDLVVTVGQIRTLAPVLTIASATYQLTISAEQPVNLATPQTSSVIQGASLEQTPLPGQNIVPPVTSGARTDGERNHLGRHIHNRVRHQHQCRRTAPGAEWIRYRWRSDQYPLPRWKHLHHPQSCDR